MPKPLPSGLPAALVRRTAGAAALVLALGGAFAAGRAFGGSDLRTDPPVQLTAQGLGTGRSCADLRSWYVAHGLDQVTAWGWHGPVLYDAMGGAPSATLPMAGSPRTDSSAPAPEARLDTTTGSATGTNVQVAAVDEPDVVKASGALLVRVVDDVLVVYDVSGHRPRRVGTAPLLGMTNTHLLLVGSRVVAIGEDAIAPRADSFYGYGMSSAGTRVRTFDLSDPTRPTEVDNRSYDASLVTARQTGDVVRLVLSTPPPSLDFVQPQDGRTDKEALEANRDLVRSSTIDDWLPTVTVEGGTAHSLVACSDVAVPTTYGGLGTMAVVGFDPASPDAVDPSAVATGSDVAMMSTGHLYVAAAPSTPYPWSGGGVMTPDLPVTNGASAKTTIYAFDLTGTSASYVGAGTVDGAVASSWSMDEWQGVLRVAVQAAYGGSATSVVLLRPRDGALTRVAALDGLGAGQQLKSVRWLDGLAIVVTFQQVDPFYALDLSDPAHPHVLGVLHLPGWSSYLHPVGSHLVLGLGQTAPGTFISPEVRIPPPAPPKPIPTPVEPAPRDLGPNDAVPGSAGTIEPQPVDPRIVTRPFFPHAKATVFDLRDLTHPRATATVDYPVGSTALAGLDPHQVSWLPDRHILLTIVSDGYSGRGWLSVLTVGQHSLDNRMVRLAPVADLGSVRTVPLADGRVVLVDGDHVRFVRV